MSGWGLTCLGHRTYGCQLCRCVMLPCVWQHMACCLVKDCCFTFIVFSPSAVLPVGHFDDNLVNSQWIVYLSGHQLGARRHQDAPQGPRVARRPVLKIAQLSELRLKDKFILLLIF